MDDYSDILSQRLRWSIAASSKVEILARLLRLNLLSTIIYTQIIAVTVPGTLLYAAIMKSGDVGVWCVSALIMLAAVGLLDLIVNDFMPSKYSLPTAWHFRHFIYMLLALGLMSVACIIVKTTKEWSPILPRYIMDTAFCAVIAFLDLFARRWGQK